MSEFYFFQKNYNYLVSGLKEMAIFEMFGLFMYHCVVKKLSVQCTQTFAQIESSAIISSQDQDTQECSLDS